MYKLAMIETEDLEYNQEPPHRVRARAKKILSILNEYKGKSSLFDQQHTRWAAGRVAKVINDAIAADIIYSEMAVLIGTSPTQAELVKLACEISGCVHFARLYSVAELGAVDIDPIDCWAKITTMNFRKDIYGDCFDCGVIFCNSVFAGRRATIIIGCDRASWWGYRLGLTGSLRKRHKWHTSYQLLGANLICRTLQVGGGIVVEGAGASESTIIANKEIAKARDRGYIPCPYGVEVDCGLCDVGTNECDWSTYTQITTVLKGLGDGTGIQSGVDTGIQSGVDTGISE